MNAVRRNPLRLLGLCLRALPLLAHKGKKHPPAGESIAGEAEQAARGAEKQLARINARYIKGVKPIFRKKCFDCHATAERLPWYSKIPGPRQLIRRDMREAKVHMDMRRDFPFGGHSTPLEDLVALEQILKDASMPPWRYRIMHRGSALSREEIQRIREWIGESRRLLATATEAKRPE